MSLSPRSLSHWPEPELFASLKHHRIPAQMAVFLLFCFTSELLALRGLFFNHLRCPARCLMQSVLKADLLRMSSELLSEVEDTICLGLRDFKMRLARKLQEANQLKN